MKKQKKAESIGFPSAERVFKLPCGFGPDTQHISVQGRRRRCHFAVAFFRPREADDKAVAVRGSKGRVPDTHTKTFHQYYKPQHLVHVCVNAQ